MRKPIRDRTRDGRLWAELSLEELNEIIEEGDMARLLRDEPTRKYMLAAFEPVHRGKQR